MHQLNTARQSSATLSKLVCIGFSTPEAKLFILFCCYFSIIVVFLGFMAVNLQRIDFVAESLETYLRCTIAGDKPECNMYKEKIEDAYRPSYFLFIFTHIMVSAFNLGNLIYALHIHDVMSIIKRICAFIVSFCMTV